jgi:ankyrin repeat protein
MKTLIIVACAVALSSISFASDPPVIEAVRSGNTSTLRELVSAKDVVLDARGSGRQTALHEAAAKCSLEAAQILVNAGLDRLIRDDANRTAAMIAMNCPESPGRNQLVRLLMVPLPPKAADETARWSLQDAAARGKISVVKMLLALGSDVNAVGTKGNRALEVACRSGNAPVTMILLDHGADIRLRTDAGTTVLHEAALGGSSEVIDMLLARGADINAVDAESRSTPLHYAASFGRLNAVKTLVRHGADVNQKNNKGMTALETAVANSQDDVVTLLRRATKQKLLSPASPSPWGTVFPTAP